MDYLLFPAAGDPSAAPIFLLLGEKEEAETIAAMAREMAGGRPFSLAALPVEDWDAALSPWPAKAVFKWGNDFSGGGDATLERISSALLPAIRDELEAPEAPVYMAGYSLAGLMAAYALFRMPGLSGAVCCSGSLWYPGFMEYAEGHELAEAPFPQRVYLSLGDKEKNSRNPVLRSVEDCTLALRDLLLGRGVDCTFVSEQGNHFQNEERRVARGIAWCLSGNGEAGG